MRERDRPYHHGNLRAALLAAAEDVLAEDGVQGLSLRDLARRAGVSHAAPRRHFADRQALLDALAEDGFARLGAAMEEALAASPAGVEARLAAVALAYLRFATRHAALAELMHVGKHREGVPPALVEAAERAFAAPLAVVREAQEAGQVEAGDPGRVATVAWAAVLGLATMANSGLIAADALDDAATDAVHRIVRGLAPR